MRNKLICLGRIRNTSGEITGYKVAPYSPYAKTDVKLLTAKQLKREYTTGYGYCVNLQLTSDNKLRPVKKHTSLEKLIPRWVFMSSREFYSAIGVNYALYKQDIITSPDGISPFFRMTSEVDVYPYLSYGFIREEKEITQTLLDDPMGIYATDPDMSLENVVITTMPIWNDDVDYMLHSRGFVFNRQHFNRIAREFLEAYKNIQSFKVVFFNNKEFTCSTRELLAHSQDLFGYFISLSKATI